MVVYRLTTKAAADLDGIYEYTILNFGLQKAQEYLRGLHERFQVLADNPRLGNSTKHQALRLRRWKYQSHVVFYVLKDSGVLIVRVLHESMDVERYLQ